MSVFESTYKINDVTNEIKRIIDKFSDYKYNWSSIRGSITMFIGAQRIYESGFSISRESDIEKGKDNIINDMLEEYEAAILFNGGGFLTIIVNIYQNGESRCAQREFKLSI